MSKVSTQSNNIQIDNKKIEEFIKKKFYRIEGKEELGKNLDELLYYLDNDNVYNLLMRSFIEEIKHDFETFYENYMNKKYDRYFNNIDIKKIFINYIDNKDKKVNCSDAECDKSKNKLNDNLSREIDEL